MSHIATITSKRQLTIPAALYKKMGFSKGDKVFIEEKDNVLHVRNAYAILDEVGGSLKVSDRLKDVDLDEAIYEAKMRHFNKPA